MLTKQVLDQNYKHQKCYKLCDNSVKVFASNPSDTTYRWDFANYANSAHSSHVLSVMSVPPSPNGSTSSIVSSEDSSSNIFGFPTIRGSQSKYGHFNEPSASSSPSFQSSVNKQLKVCRVCGDRAKSYHFGGISCDSCKAFFRRSVQNEAYRNFHCPYERHCDITINSRKSCQYCRFHKCLSIGMEKSWVMTEEERMQMLKNRIEKRKQEEEVSVSVRPSIKPTDYYVEKYEADFTQINRFLSEDEVKLIENLVNLQLKCWQEISFSLQSDSQPNRTDILNIFFTAIQQFTLFAQRFQSFTCISNHDKQILLRDGVLELCFLRGAFNYDMKGKYWRYDQRSDAVIYSDHLQIMVTKDLLEKHMQFIKSIKRLCLEETTFTLLSLIVLLSSDRETLTDSHSVQREQETYLLLLKKYMNWRYGPRVSSLLYPKLLLKLTDLRELAETHTDYHLSLCRQELNQIRQKLSSLSIRTDSSPVNSRIGACDTTSVTTSMTNPIEWTIMQSITDNTFANNLYADEELSTSSEGSEKLSSD